MQKLITNFYFIFFSSIGIFIGTISNSYATAFFHEELIPISVTGKDFLGLLGPKYQDQTDYKVKIDSSLVINDTLPNFTSDEFSIYPDAGIWSMEIQYSWIKNNTPHSQTISLHPDINIIGDVKVTNDCSHCPILLDSLTLRFIPKEWEEIGFRVTWNYPRLFDFISYEHIASLDIFMYDYDSSIFTDTSLPTTLPLDEFEETNIIMNVGSLDSHETGAYLLRIKSVPTPSSFYLFIAGMLTVLIRKKLV